MEGRYAANFMQTNDCTNPIAPSGSCTITLTFSPVAEGSPKAYLFFWDDAGSGRHQIRLVGTGQ